MQATVKSSFINGTISAPASKSAMQRACAAALIRNGRSVLHNPGVSADDEAALQIIQQLGALAYKEGSDIIISSRGIAPVSDTIHCGESGLSVRMFTSLAAVSDRELFVKGAGSLVKRPLHFFDEVLPLLQCRIKSNHGHLPMQVKGPIVPSDITIDGSLSSQFLTGLLFAFSAVHANDVTITVNNLNSKPYIDLSLHVLEKFGLKVPENRNYREFYFNSDDQLTASGHTQIEYTVEGDWSSASFLLVAGAINGNLHLNGLDVFSTQADKAILQALMQTGVQLSIRDHEILIRSGKLKAFHFNATDCPDLFPPLVALAAYCEGTSVIEGVNRLLHKESNRAESLQQEFKKLGVEVELQDDLMVIRSCGKVQGGVVDSHNDHRIAMAAAVAALKADAPVQINRAEAVRKSYPRYFEDLKSLGISVQVEGSMVHE